MSKPVWRMVDPRFPEQFGRRVVCCGPCYQMGIQTGIWVEPVADDGPCFPTYRIAVPEHCLINEAEYEFVRATKGIS